VPTLVDGGVSCGQRGGSSAVVNLSFLDQKSFRSGYILCVFVLHAVSDVILKNRRLNHAPYITLLKGLTGRCRFLPLSFISFTLSMGMNANKFITQLSSGGNYT
jgi:hypothetical protein